MMSAGGPSVVVVRLLSGKLLKDTQTFGTQDVHAIVKLGQREARTGVKKDGGKNPVFSGPDFIASLPAVASEFEQAWLYINLYNGKTKIGTAQLHARRLLTADVEQEWLPVSGNTGAALQVNITFSGRTASSRPAPPQPPRGAPGNTVSVTLVQGKGIKDTQTFGTQDPFAKVRIGKREEKTATLNNGGTSPDFSKGNFTVSHSVSPGELASQWVYVTLFNENVTGSTKIGMTRFHGKRLLGDDISNEFFPIDTGGSLKLTVTYTGRASSTSASASASAPAPAPAFPSGPGSGAAAAAAAARAAASRPVGQAAPVSAAGVPVHGGVPVAKAVPVARAVPYHGGMHGGGGSGGPPPYSSQPVAAAVATAPAPAPAAPQGYGMYPSIAPYTGATNPAAVATPGYPPASSAAVAPSAAAAGAMATQAAMAGYGRAVAQAAFAGLTAPAVPSAPATAFPASAGQPAGMPFGGMAPAVAMPTMAPMAPAGFGGFGGGMPGYGAPPPSMPSTAGGAFGGGFGGGFGGAGTAPPPAYGGAGTAPPAYEGAGGMAGGGYPTAAVGGGPGMFAAAGGWNTAPAPAPAAAVSSVDVRGKTRSQVMHDLEWTLQTAKKANKMSTLYSFCTSPAAPFTAKECAGLLGNVTLGRDYMVEGACLLYRYTRDRENFKSQALFGMWRDEKVKVIAQLRL